MRTSPLHPSEHVAAPNPGAAVSRSPRPTQGLAPSHPAGRQSDASHRADGIVVATDVDLVIPVYNEQRGLDSSVDGCTGFFAPSSVLVADHHR
jgi:hypothetical protein